MKSDNEQCNTIRRISNFLFVLLLSDTAKEAPMTKLKWMKRRSLERTKPKRKLRSHQRWITPVTWRGRLSEYHFPNWRGKCSSISSVIRNQTWFLCGGVKVFSIILKALKSHQPWTDIKILKLRQTLAIKCIKVRLCPPLYDTHPLKMRYLLPL